MLAMQRLSLAIGLALLPTAQAEVVTDGSLGAVEQLSGAMTIPEALGQRRGGNLFHSFASFNIASDESATFTGSADITHVIGRVTGGSASEINGALRSEVGGADLILFNPAGILIGPGASFDVPGALHLGTADELRLADGSRFSASDPTPQATLTSAPPEAFGFLDQGGGSGQLSVQGEEWDESIRYEACDWDGTCGTYTDTITHRTSHTLVSGSSFTLAARDLTIDTTGFAGEDLQVQLAAVGSAAGSVALGAGAVQVGDDGTLTITNQATFDLSGDGSANLALHAAEMRLDQAHLSSDNGSGLDASGEILLRATQLTLDHASSLSVSDSASGSAPSLRVEAERLSLDHAASLASRLNGGSGGGSVTITGGDLTLHNYAAIDTNALTTIALSGNLWMDGESRITTSATFSTLDAGDILLAAQNLNMEAATISTAAGYNSGRGGDIRITLSGDATLTYGAQISASTISEIGTDAGSITLDAANLRISGTNFDYEQLLNERDPERIATPPLELVASGLQTAAGLIYTMGFFDAAAGDILINLHGGELRLENNGEISSASHFAGPSGNIEIQAGTLIIDHATLSSENNAMANFMAPPPDPNAPNPLDGGTISLTLDQRLTMQGGTITTVTAFDGAGGDILITAPQATLDSRATINSSTTAYHENAGDIYFDIAEHLLLDGGSTIRSGTYGVGYSTFGNGSTITLVLGGDLTLQNASRIDAESIGGGNAGTLILSADNLYIDGLDSGLYTNSSDGTSWYGTYTGGTAGDIQVDLRGDARLSAGGRISSSATVGSATRNDDDWGAGNIAINAQQLVISGVADDGGNAHPSGIFTLVAPTDNSQASYRRPGDIQIQVVNLTLDQGATINSENQSGLAKPDLAQLSSLSLSGTQLLLGQDASITSAALGDAPASPIDIRFAGRIELANAEITTTAVNGNGGDIFIDPVVMLLRDSRITTSVSGSSGNGGDIHLIADHLVLDGGFIQANTAASGASGGEITLNTQSLIPYGGLVSVADPARQPFTPGVNVIQAAAPSGVNGIITITAPDLDLAGELAALETPYMDPARLFSGGCAERAGTASRLAWGGRSGLPWSSGAPLLMVPWGEQGVSGKGCLEEVSG